MTLCAVSLNLAKEPDPDTVANVICATPRLRDADLFLFQEVRHEKGKASVADEVGHHMGHSVSFAAATDADDQGLAIVSRYPILDTKIQPLKACNLRFRCRNRFAMAVTVSTPLGGLRIWNVHLDTRINAQERLQQLQPVLEDAARYTGPQLIGGDFNTNNLRWLGNVFPLPLGPAHSAALRTVMRQHNFESPFPDELVTCPPIRRHLDWIFVSGLETLDAGAEPVPFSDHRAIWVRAQIG